MKKSEKIQRLISSSESMYLDFDEYGMGVINIVCHFKNYFIDLSDYDVEQLQLLTDHINKEIKRQKECLKENNK